MAKTHGKNRLECLGDAHGDATVVTDRADPATSALVSALRVRSAGLAEHSQRVADLAIGLGTRLGFAGRQLKHLRAAALLHDIGRMSLPDTVLTGAGPLSRSDWELIRQHPQAAFDLLGTGFPAEVAEVVRSHHEHLDGSGYPDGLAGDDIPELARLVLVCDAFDAMTSERPYRAPLARSEALIELEASAGTIFDPDMVREFARMVKREGDVVSFPIARAG
ncbi:MAG: HD domain-containing protein [Acidimicrobiia bacterium]|nr:HD domain-containing protein [Acidimicrobiia bacterium]